jgi:cell division protein FtsQ
LTDTDLVTAQRRFERRQRSARLRSRLPWVLGTIVVVAGVLAVWLFYFSSVFAVGGVRVEGLSTVPEQEVTAAAAVPDGEPLARVDLAAIAQRVRAIPAVADARAGRSWPDRVVISVTERVAVVAVAAGSRFDLVDATGSRFRQVSSRPAGLPQAVVTGPRRDVTTRSVVTVAAALPDDLRPRVRSIAAASPDSINLHLGGGVRVVWGSADHSDRKATVVVALMRRKATVYDVSAPDSPVTQGEK